MLHRVRGVRFLWTLQIKFSENPLPSFVTDLSRIRLYGSNIRILGYTRPGRVTRPVDGVTGTVRNLRGTRSRHTDGRPETLDGSPWQNQEGRQKDYSRIIGDVPGSPTTYLQWHGCTGRRVWIQRLRKSSTTGNPKTFSLYHPKCVRMS